MKYKIFKAIVYVAIGSAIGMCFTYSEPIEVINQTKYITADTQLKAKIEELKNEVLDKLKACESGDVTEDSGLIVFDSNKVASIGLYQFQKNTVIHYYKVLYGKEITGKEAIEVALDGTRARELAKDIIFSDDNGIANWYNCQNKMNLLENIKWINKISK